MRPLRAWVSRLDELEQLARMRRILRSGRVRQQGSRCDAGAAPATVSGDDGEITTGPADARPPGKVRPRTIREPGDLLRRVRSWSPGLERATVTLACARAAFSCPRFAYRGRGRIACRDPPTRARRGEAPRQ